MHHQSHDSPTISNRCLISCRDLASISTVTVIVASYSALEINNASDFDLADHIFYVTNKKKFIGVMSEEQSGQGVDHHVQCTDPISSDV